MAIEKHIKKFWKIFIKGLPEEARYVLKNYLIKLVEKKFHVKLRERRTRGKEVIEMVTTAIDEWREELLQKGKREGEQKGILNSIYDLWLT